MLAPRRAVVSMIDGVTDTVPCAAAACGAAVPAPEAAGMATAAAIAPADAMVSALRFTVLLLGCRFMVFRCSR